MILGQNIFSKLNIDLYFSNNTIWINGGAEGGCTEPMKDSSKINFNTSSNFLKDEIFCNTELFENKHVHDATYCTCHILDSHCKKYNLHKVAS